MVIYVEVAWPSSFGGSYFHWRNALRAAWRSTSDPEITFISPTLPFGSMVAIRFKSKADKRFLN
jgi:hypothetical protein